MGSFNHLHLFRQTAITCCMVMFGNQQATAQIFMQVTGCPLQHGDRRLANGNHMARLTPAPANQRPVNRLFTIDDSKRRYIQFYQLIAMTGHLNPFVCMKLPAQDRDICL
jgi:hypothetical protein